MSDILSEQELLEIRNEMQKRCDILFQELEDTNLITPNPIREFDAKIFTSWLNEDHMVITKGLGKIVAKTDSIIDDTFSRQDFVHFVIYLSAYSFVVQIEQLKDDFVSCLDKDRLYLDDDDSLGKIIYKINQQINPLEQTPQADQESARQKRKERKELFFLDFRNAITHRRYTVHAESLTYLIPPDNVEVNITVENFTRMKEQFAVVGHYIMNYEKMLISRYQNTSS